MRAKFFALSALFLALFTNIATAKANGIECVRTAAELAQHQGISAAVHGVNLFTTWKARPMIGVTVTMTVNPENGVATVVLPKIMGPAESYPSKLCVDFGTDATSPFMVVLKNGNEIRVDFDDASLMTFFAPPELTGKGMGAKFTRVN